MRLLYRCHRVYRRIMNDDVIPTGYIRHASHYSKHHLSSRCVCRFSFAFSKRHPTSPPLQVKSLYAPLYKTNSYVCVVRLSRYHTTTRCTWPCQSVPLGTSIRATQNRICPSNTTHGWLILSLADFLQTCKFPRTRPSGPQSNRLPGSA